MKPAEITHRRVLNVAIPIVISNATYPILGAVDTGVVGQLGDAVPIGAVGMGAVILSGLYWIFGFLRMGTSGLVAQARGAGDVPETYADVDDLMKDIGFKPKTSIEEGIAKFVEWYKEYYGVK